MKTELVRVAIYTALLVVGASYGCKKTTEMRQKVEASTIELRESYYKLGVLHGMEFTHNHIEAAKLGSTNFNAPARMRPIIANWDCINKVTFITNE